MAILAAALMSRCSALEARLYSRRVALHGKLARTSSPWVASNPNLNSFVCITLRAKRTAEETGAFHADTVSILDVDIVVVRHAAQAIAVSHHRAKNNFGNSMLLNGL
jgi:hypothetical protein